MRRPLVAAAVLASLLVSSSALAATYQVGPSRTLKTLTAVAPMLGPGDVVELDGDASYGSVVFDQPGAAGNPVTIRGISVNGNRPIVQGGTNTIEAQANHYVFENLELTGGSFRCFFHHADDIVLRATYIHDCPKHGVLGADQDSGSLLMEYCEVTKCGGGTQDHQIYMATDETAYPGSVFRLQHSWIHDGNGGNNVKSRAERNEIYSNWIEGALYHELELIGPDGQDEALAREDSDVVGNVLVKTNTFFVVRFGGDGTGQTFGRYRFVNNTVLAGTSAVFRLFDGIESVEMHNNVFFRPGGTVNMVRQAEAAWVSGELIGGSNNWVQMGATNVPAVWTGTILGASPGLDADNRPMAGSPLLDAGNGSPQPIPGHAVANTLGAPAYHPPIHVETPVGMATPRPVDGMIDIGAFEFGMGSSGAGGSGTAGSGTAGTGTAGTGTAGTGTAGTGTAGTGTSGSGTAGTGTAGTGTAGTGTAGTGTAGTGTAGTGTSGSGTAGTGTAGAGGSGTAGSAAGKAGAGGSGNAGTGTSGSGTAGSATAGSASAGKAGAGGAKAGSAGSATAGTSAAGASAAAATSEDDGGCGCRTAGDDRSAGLGLAALGLAVALRRRRR